MDIDRIAPTRRPVGHNAGTQRWSDLLFVHYEVEPKAIEAVLPKGLELDLYEGRAFVGVVPFRMERIAPPLVPSILGLNFLETNLRVYVHHRGRPGVYFLSLDASNPLAVRVARRFFYLPYTDAKMSVSIDDRGERDYRSARKSNDAFVRARYQTGAALPPARPGTLEHFLLERYLLFVERGGRLYSGAVNHVPYPRTEVDLISFDESLVQVAGLVRHRGAPDLVHASPGVDVEVFAITPCD